MSKSEPINEHGEFERSIFKQASDNLERSGFNGDYGSWEAACRLIRVMDGMGFTWTTSLGSEGCFHMILVEKTRTNEQIRSKEVLILNLSVQLSPQSANGSFIFKIPNTELGPNDIKDNHFFVFVCIIENLITYFMFPHRKIENEIGRGLSRARDTDGGKFTINIEEFTTKAQGMGIKQDFSRNSDAEDWESEINLEELVTKMEKLGYFDIYERRALIVETGSNVTYYGNNFRFLSDKLKTSPIVISRDLEEVFMGSVPNDILGDVVALAGLDELRNIIERRADNDGTKKVEVEKYINEQKRKRKNNKK